MRLALKFAVSFLIVTVCGWGVASYIRIQREISLFEQDIRRDHESVGMDLSVAVADIWRLGGEEAARKLINQANESKSSVTITLISLDSLSSAPALQGHVVSDSIIAHFALQPRNFMWEDSLGDEWVYTYIPVVTDSTASHVIELAESLAEKDRYIGQTIRNAVIYTLSLGFVAGAVALLLGVVFIARPVTVLIKKARRVAEGDLRTEARLQQNDELGELAVELNSMSTRLDEARHQIAIESAARETASLQLRHADKLTTVGKMAASLAHELGTPLNVIKGRARMIADEEIEGEQILASSKSIIEQSDRMSRIIRGLLDLSRRDARSIERVDLQLLINQAVDLIGPTARQRKVTLSVNAQTSPIYSDIDIDQIRQVLLNLMFNAVESMPNGGELAIVVEKSMPYQSSGDPINGDSCAIIIVRDTGCGIPPEHISRLFEPFFTTKDPKEGTGLGLSISADIVSEHGGRIEVSSTPGEGSEFRVYLPIPPQQAGRETT